MSAERLRVIDSQLAELQERSSGLKAQWESEKAVIASIRGLKQQVERARDEAQRAERDGELARAAELRYGTLPELNQRLDAASTRFAAIQKSGGLLKEEVTDETSPTSCRNGPEFR